MRSRAGYNTLASDPTPAPATTLQEAGQSGISGDLASWLRSTFPALKSLPGTIAQGLPLTSLLSLNEALVKDYKATKKLDPEAKLAASMEKLLEQPVFIPSGWDNRKTKLHAGRFIGGATCMSQALWLEARKHIGPEGVAPLGAYDLDAVGCGGSVAPKGWLEIHNPGSTQLNIRMFHMPNVANRVYGKEVESGDSLKDVVDMEELRRAVFTLREAMAQALPWNHSVAAIQGFLHVSNYCKKDLDTKPNRAAILSSFINYVLGRNALNWQNSQPFITTSEMVHVWSTWFGQQPISTLGRRQGPKQPNKEKNDLCRRYNEGACTTTGSTCKTYYGKVLRHLCNAVKADGKLCELPHPKKDHK